jgi:CheY-like chemotaxis protein
MLTVLIVESERGLREKAENVLGVAGYRTFAAAQADEALALLRDHPEIDLLFTDTRIEGPASGYGLARAAKNARPDLKVLYSTDRPDELLRLGRPIDPEHILSKPYQAVDLERAVSWLLRTPA